MASAGKNSAIERLFHPSNVVLVGASDRSGHWSERVWDNLRRFGFPGRVFPVNPNRNEIWGATCFPNLGALPEPPDHLAIYTPADATIGILTDGGTAGGRGGALFWGGVWGGANTDGAGPGKRTPGGAGGTAHH